MLSFYLSIILIPILYHLQFLICTALLAEAAEYVDCISTEGYDDPSKCLRYVFIFMGFRTIVFIFIVISTTF